MDREAVKMIFASAFNTTISQISLPEFDVVSQKFDDVAKSDMQIARRAYSEVVEAIVRFVCALLDDCGRRADSEAKIEALLGDVEKRRRILEALEAAEELEEPKNL